MQVRRTFVHTRREFLSGLAAGAALASSACSRSAAPESSLALTIKPMLFDIAKDHTISTTGYEGGEPGKVIRLKEGQPVAVTINNELDTPELVHWHGQIIPADIDGAEEEHSLI